MVIFSRWKLKWPWVSRKKVEALLDKYELQLASLRERNDIAEHQLKAQMMNQIRDAVDRLPELNKKLEALVDVTIKAWGPEGQPFYDSNPNNVTLTTRIDINREVIPQIDDEAMTALLAGQIARAVRYKLEERRTVDIPAILAECIKEE